MKKEEVLPKMKQMVYNANLRGTGYTLPATANKIFTTVGEKLVEKGVFVRKGTAYFYKDQTKIDAEREKRVAKLAVVPKEKVKKLTVKKQTPKKSTKKSVTSPVADVPVVQPVTAPQTAPVNALSEPTSVPE